MLRPRSRRILLRCRDACVLAVDPREQLGRAGEALALRPLFEVLTEVGQRARPEEPRVRLERVRGPPDLPRLRVPESREQPGCVAQERARELADEGAVAGPRGELLERLGVEDRLRLADGASRAAVERVGELVEVNRLAHV